MAYKSGKKIDLHIHSNASDGSLGPDNILSRALKLGLSAISITDHDTLAGVRTILESPTPEGIEFMSGIEISAGFPPSWPNAGSMHILGYGITTDHPGLNSLLEKQQSARSNRTPLIIRKLNDLGIDVSLDSISAYTGKEEIARPNIAEYLVKHGYAESIDEAFDRLLGKGRPAYVDKFRATAEEVIKLIRAAGGIAVLAHPMLFTEEGGNLEDLIAELKILGLGGIEVYYSGHSDRQTAYLQKLAERHDLLVTGGTDFHGDINPDIEMGSGLGSLYVPYEIFKRLKTAIENQDLSR